MASVAACGTTVHSPAGVRAAQDGSGLSVPTTAPSPGSATGQPGETGTGPAGAVPGSTSPGGRSAGVGPGSITGTGPTVIPAGSSTGPIKVGFMYSVNDAAESAGVDNHTSINAGNVMHTLVASYNEHGGFSGRHIEPVYASIRSSSNDFEGDLAAACAKLTQDNHVAVV